MLCNACFYRRRVYSLIIYVRVTCAGLSTLPTQISEHGCTHEFQTKNNNFSFNRVFGRIYWISFSKMISLVRILAKFVELLSLLFRSRKFKTKHVVSIIRIVYIQHTALSPCNRSLSQQFSALVFPGLRRPIPREFPPDLIARARARVHQTFQDLYFIFNIARVAPAMIYFHQLANRVLSNHPLGSESIHLYSYIDPFIENGTSVPCIFFTDFSSVRPPLRPLRKSGNKYLFP